MKEIEIHLSRRRRSIVVRGGLERDLQLVGVGGMKQALAGGVRSLEAEAVLHAVVEDGRQQAVAGRSGRLSLTERVQDDSEALTPVHGDGPRTARRAGGHGARTRRHDVAGLRRQGSM